MEQYRIAIVGATTLVGQELLRILEQRKFPLSAVRLFAMDGADTGVVFGSQHTYPVLPLRHDAERDAFREIDLVFFAGGEDASRHLVDKARRAGATVIDGSSVYRLEPDVPLVVPEVNAGDIQGHAGLIASPGCAAILLNVALYPLHKINPIKRIVVSTYQSTSGLGAAAMSELTLQTQQVLAGETPRHGVLPHEIAFNILPQVDVFLDNGYTREEWQLLGETRKILHDENILVSATCARVPTFKGHCQAITAEFSGEIDPEKARDVLAEAAGVRLVDDAGISLYPQPRNAAGTDLVMVGRVRQDVFNDNGLVVWLAADNIRKGAALNMAQIAEEMSNRSWLRPGGQR